MRTDLRECVMYPVYDLASTYSDRPEMLGTKEKFWLVPHPGQDLENISHLFKIGRPGTGENWSEKAAFEIAKRIGLPCARYEFAIHEGRQGVITPTFLPLGSHMLSANFFLARVVNGYDGEKRFNHYQYRISTVLNMLLKSNIEQPLDCGTQLSGLSSPEVFIGYLFFDALIGNTDRHHENWGVVLHGDPLRRHLAPTFDHASSLGRNETDERREFRLTTRDRRADVEAYASRGRSAFFGNSADTKTLFHKDLVQHISNHHKEISKFWTTAICSISTSEFEEIFSHMEKGWISNAASDFAIRMLSCNQRMIEEVGLAP